MKILLIAPARNAEWGESFWEFKTVTKLTSRNAGGAILALPTLAALTPSDIEVKITDEMVEPINFNEDVDLVAISFLTSLAPRAYEIADEFRRRKAKVVLGGIHASMLSEEAILHADSIVVGEADELWLRVVNDFKKGNLQKFYKADCFPNLENLPIPSWDLLRTDEYCYFTVQAGRGCPNKCDFCSVWSYNGHEYRHKTVSQLVDEIKYLQSIDSKKLIFFADDNLLSKPDFAKSLFKNLIHLRINNWWCQASINRLNDDRLLNLMYKSGCRAVFVGFESVCQKSISELNKNKINKVEKYIETVDLIHSNGISVIGSFMLGNDNDGIGIFDETADFINQSNMAFAMINIVTPAPGTLLYEKLLNQRRITSKLWHQYNGEEVCFQTKQILPERLQSERNKLLKRVYEYNTLYSRLNDLWKKNVFVRGQNERRSRITKGRFLFTFKALSFDMKRNIFLIKSLWNKRITSTSAINLSLNFCEYAKKLKTFEK